MRTFNQQVTTAQPNNANYTSPYVPLRNIIVYCMAAIFTGTPTGTIKLQASNDPETNDTVSPNFPIPTNWVDIANSTFTVTSAGEEMWNVANYAIGYNYVRVVYTDTSGGAATGTFNIVFNGKGS